MIAVPPLSPRGPTSALSPSAGAPARRRRPQARYMAHDLTGVLSQRRAPLRDVKLDVREAWGRSAALAWDFIANNGWIAGAADQAIADAVGVGLKLNAKPSLEALGYTAAEQSAWCRLVEREWASWANNPAECDLEGKATLAELLDGALRYFLAEGEAFAVLDYMSPAQRARYGLAWGTKIRLAAPHRCRSDGLAGEGWEDGILHDALGRPIAYRFRRREGPREIEQDFAARAGPLVRVVHAMDRGAVPNGNRGISPMAPVFMTAAQSDQLANATLTTALLQTAFAATIRSPEPTDGLVQALESLAGMDDQVEGTADVARDLVDAWQQRLAAIRDEALTINAGASRVNHLAPGEEFEIHGSKTPGPDYLPFARDLRREIARGLGVLYEAVSLDYSGATYSSVRMGVATIWPMTLRRRARIAAPIAQGAFEAFMDEGVATGRIPLRGGYPAFAANRAAVCGAEWQGPERPTADPYKDALGHKIGLECSTTTLQEICGARPRLGGGRPPGPRRGRAAARGRARPRARPRLGRRAGRAARRRRAPGPPSRRTRDGPAHARSRPLRARGRAARGARQARRRRGGAGGRDRVRQRRAPARPLRARRPRSPRAADRRGRGRLRARAGAPPAPTPARDGRPFPPLLTETTMATRLEGDRGGRLYLSGFVGEDTWDDGFTYGSVGRALAGVDREAPLAVHLNSPGGYSWDGIAIHSLLTARPGDTDVVVDGVAASAASVVAMAGRRIVMTQGAMMMIHDPWTMTLGNMADHESTMAMLERDAANIAGIYAARTGLAPDEARALMRAETWMTAAEAVARGFATDASEAAFLSADEPAPFAYDRAYAHAPEPLRALARSRGWRPPRGAARCGPPGVDAPAPDLTARQESPMTDQPQAQATQTQAPQAQATQTQAPQAAAPDLEQVRAEAAAEAVRADRERRGAVMASAEAKGREALAEHLLTATDMPAAAIAATLAAAPGAAAPAAPEPQPFAAQGLASSGLGGAPQAQAQGRGDASTLDAAMERINAGRRRR